MSAESILFQDTRATITTQRIVIDGAMVATAQVAGAQVIERRKHGIGPWIVTIVVAGCGFLFHPMILLIAAVFLVVSIASVFTREQLVGINVAGHVSTVGKPGDVRWVELVVHWIVQATLRR